MEISLQINNNVLKKDAKNIIMDTTPYLDAEKGRTMVPPFVPSLRLLGMTFSG